MLELGVEEDGVFIGDFEGTELRQLDIFLFGLLLMQLLQFFLVVLMQFGEGFAVWLFGLLSDARRSWLFLFHASEQILDLD